MTRPRLDGGSFRDRLARVFFLDGKVYRALSEPALADWQRLADSEFFPRLSEAGKIVATRRADLPAEPLAELGSHWVAALEHERIPFVSYPYEWSFGMLRDAAALQLELLDAALAEGQILKDATSYNVQWRGARPTFIDITSFEALGEGDVWVGYSQFCQLFLYPLFLTAYKDVAFHPWLRGAIDGIRAEEMNRLFGLRDRFRSGVLADVYLQAKLQARNAARQDSVRSELRQAGVSRQMIVNNVRRLRKVVAGLEWGRDHSEWADYADDNSYDRADAELKERFVASAAGHRRWSLVWDLGCNTGVFSRIAAEHADYVLAIDGDHLAVERLYRQLRDDGPENILPLVMNLADASPSQGWRLAERPDLASRGKPELVFCLALIHHLVITANIPLGEVFDWLASLGAHLVIEFVAKDDPMVERLLLNKADIYHDYTPEGFERALGERFEVVDSTPCESGTRTLYFARPRGD